MKKNLLKKVLALALSATMALAPVVSYAGDFEITEEVVWGNNDQSEEQSYAGGEQSYSGDEVEESVFEEDENGLYTRCSEYLTEREYSDKEIRNMLEKSGFRVLAYYGFLTFDAPESDEQRVVYTAQKL